MGGVHMMDELERSIEGGDKNQSLRLAEIVCGMCDRITEDKLWFEIVDRFAILICFFRGRGSSVDSLARERRMLRAKGGKSG